MTVVRKVAVVPGADCFASVAVFQVQLSNEFAHHAIGGFVDGSYMCVPS